MNTEKYDADLSSGYALEDNEAYLAKPKRMTVREGLLLYGTLAYTIGCVFGVTCWLFYIGGKFLWRLL